MAQKNRANMLTDIVNNIYNNLINFITGQNAQDRFVNLLDSSPNILSDKNQASGYVGTDANNEMLSGYYIEQLSVVAAQTLIAGSDLVSLKAYLLDDADAGNRIIKVLAAGGVTNQFYQYGIDATTGEIGTYDITTDVFSPIVSSAQTLAQTLILGNTSGANDIQFDATQGLLFDNSSRLREGTIDAGLGGLKGIAQICGAGYELKWENGRLYVMGSSGNTIRQSLYNLTTTPTVTDDDTLGYSVGSLWTLDDGTVYVCSDATTGAAVWAIGGIPDLQQVTTAGATTTNGITVDNGLGESVVIKHDRIKIVNALGADAVILSPTLATATEFQLPDKLSSPQTFAMLEDVTALSFVPYTGATADVDLDNNGLDAKFVKIKGTAGNGHLNLKHQSSGATAGGSESVLYADNSGNPAWKNDGNALQSLLTNSNITQVITNGVTDKAPSEDAVFDALALKTNTQTLTCIGLVIVMVNDAANYHIGTIAATPAGIDARRAFKPTANCTVTAASLSLEQVGNGSNETVSIYLRNVTDATETLIGTFTSDFGASTTLKTLFSGLSISLVTTKDYTIRFTTPTWVTTNPSQWIPAVTLQMTL